MFLMGSHRRPGGCSSQDFWRLQFTKAASEGWPRAPHSMLKSLKGLVLKHFTPHKTSDCFGFKLTLTCCCPPHIRHRGNAPITTDKAARQPGSPAQREIRLRTLCQEWAALSKAPGYKLLRKKKPWTSWWDIPCSSPACTQWANLCYSHAYRKHRKCSIPWILTTFYSY